MNKWYHGVGKKKCSIARVYIKINKNLDIIINKKEVKNYFSNNLPYKIFLQPLIETKTFNKFYIKINVKGGGNTSQILAIRLGLSKALVKFNKSFKKILSKKKFLTRDSRIVERKKIGYKKARKKKQFSKR